MTSAVELNGLTKAFGDFLAVDAVSAVAQPGEVTALLGPIATRRRPTVGAAPAWEPRVVEHQGAPLGGIGRAVGG